MLICIISDLVFKVVGLLIVGFLPVHHYVTIHNMKLYAELGAELLCNIAR
jgi:hypothetical protein